MANKTTWAWPCTPEEAANRSRGRRYLLTRRRAARADRRARIAAYILESGMDAFAFGTAGKIAVALGLERRTVCRDLTALGWGRGGRGKHLAPAVMVERLEKPGAPGHNN